MRLPEWIKAKSRTGLHKTKQTLRGHRLSTVCEEARCPNIGACFTKPTATFLILGPACTRNCGFCSVESAPPLPPDPEEPARVARAAFDLGLRYIVITSVTRDDLPDGGAAHFNLTIRAVREIGTGIRVEVLTPDFQGDTDALSVVLDARPDVFNHNIETVPRLYPVVRPQADYNRSLRVLANARRLSPGIAVKSGIMVGLGETFDEVAEALRDLRKAGCDLVTIGQYLQPRKENLPVLEYVTPAVFELYKDVASGLGFRGVASGPLVRSSMDAEEMSGLAPQPS